MVKADRTNSSWFTCAAGTVEGFERDRRCKGRFKGVLSFVGCILEEKINFFCEMKLPA